MQYLVKYNMLKWFKELFKDYNQVQDELNAMGIFSNPWGSWFNQEMFDQYYSKINTPKDKKD